MGSIRSSLKPSMCFAPVHLPFGGSELIKLHYIIYSNLNCNLRMHRYGTIPVHVPKWARS